jgi:hypothetical protein
MISEFFLLDKHARGNISANEQVLAKRKRPVPQLIPIQVFQLKLLVVPLFLSRIFLFFDKNSANQKRPFKCCTVALKSTGQSQGLA